MMKYMQKLNNMEYETESLRYLSNKKTLMIMLKSFLLYKNTLLYIKYWEVKYDIKG